MVLSAVDLHDPDHDAIHLGLADEVFLPLWDPGNPTYVWVWQHIFWETAKLLLRSTKEEVTIMIYCRSGKHRALASSNVVVVFSY